MGRSKENIISSAFSFSTTSYKPLIFFPFSQSSQSHARLKPGQILLSLYSSQRQSTRSTQISPPKISTLEKKKKLFRQNATSDTFQTKTQFRVFTHSHHISYSPKSRITCSDCSNTQNLFQRAPNAHQKCPTPFHLPKLPP